MSNFQIGQRVVCIDASPSRNIRSRHKKWLVKGRVYTIAGIDRDALLIDGDPDLILHSKTGRPIGWLAERFRPVKTTDISIFTAMLAPTPRVKQPV